MNERITGHAVTEKPSVFERRMAEGHLIRTGHQLAGHYEGVGFERHLVRECCGKTETAPEIIADVNA